MGKTLDGLFGKHFNSSKFKSFLNLTISRLSVLKNQKQSRVNHAKKDVLDLIHNGEKERALLRVEYVIKDRNMLDVFVLIDGFCHLLIERVPLIEEDREECPVELREAISSLIYASSRCGELPELKEMREILQSWYGKDFVSAALELRNECGVNIKMLQKMSTKQLPLEQRMKMLEEISEENGIQLNMDETVSELTLEGLGLKKDQLGKAGDLGSVGKGKLKKEEGPFDQLFPADMNKEEALSRMGSNYKSAIAAAEDAYKSAAHAAAAAKAAVELSFIDSLKKGSSHDDDNDDNDHGSLLISSSTKPTSSTALIGSSKPAAGSSKADSPSPLRPQQQGQRTSHEPAAGSFKGDHSSPSSRPQQQGQGTSHETVPEIHKSETKAQSEAAHGGDEQKLVSPDSDTQTMMVPVQDEPRRRRDKWNPFANWGKPEQKK